ncbi:MAG: hypothetical protein ABI134_25620 [Byssovorax sp.]
MLGIACNTVSPDECWLNTSGGFGGSGTIPIGAGVGATSGGDPLEPPRGPLDSRDSEAPNPCIMPPTPCNGKCLDAYQVAAIGCGKTEDEAERKTCDEGAYAAYRSCVQNCTQIDVTDCLERCKEQCDKENIRCIKNCPKGDGNCMNECNQENGRCLKECDKRCK